MSSEKECVLWPRLLIYVIRDPGPRYTCQLHGLGIRSPSQLHRAHPFQRRRIVEPQLQLPPQQILLRLVLLVRRHEVVDVVDGPVQDDRFRLRLARRPRRRRLGGRRCSRRRRWRRRRRRRRRGGVGGWCCGAPRRGIERVGGGHRGRQLLDLAVEHRSVALLHGGVGARPAVRRRRLVWLAS